MPGLVSSFCEFVHGRKELWRLTTEQPHVGQELDHALGNIFGFGRANDRAWREAWAEEWAGLRHNQVVPQNLPGAAVVRKGQAVGGVGDIERRRNRSASLVLPGLKVHGLGRTDADQDS